MRIIRHIGFDLQRRQRTLPDGRREVYTSCPFHQGRDFPARDPTANAFPMAQFIEFISNHPVLSGMWVVTLLAIIVYHSRAASRSVGPQQAVMMINREGAVVVDVRDRKEFDQGHISGAINIPLVKLKQRMAELNKHKDKPKLVVCKMGQQSGAAVKSIEEAGHGNVVKLAGGISEWTSRSFPLIQK